MWRKGQGGKERDSCLPKQVAGDTYIDAKESSPVYQREWGMGEETTLRRIQHGRQTKGLRKGPCVVGEV